MFPHANPADGGSTAMPYVSRDASGAIRAIFEKANGEASEQLAPDHPEITTFLERGHRSESPRITLGLTDSEMSRVLEDLIQCLLDKRLILKSDLPPAALDKISYRRSLRDKMHDLGSLVCDKRDRAV